jgi:stalled ribosome rescue protein Dom34
MSLRQTIVWIDHKEARIFGVNGEAPESATILAPQRHLHRHPKGATAESHHPHDARRFFHDVAGALEGAAQILLVGPSTAKLQFLRYVTAHSPALEAKIVGSETVDHPTDAQLVAHAKRYFSAVGRAHQA